MWQGRDATMEPVNHLGKFSQNLTEVVDVSEGHTCTDAGANAYANTHMLILHDHCLLNVSLLIECPH